MPQHHISLNNHHEWTDIHSTCIHPNECYIHWQSYRICVLLVAVTLCAVRSRHASGLRLGVDTLIDVCSEIHDRKCNDFAHRNFVKDLRHDGKFTKFNVHFQELNMCMGELFHHLSERLFVRCSTHVCYNFVRAKHKTVKLHFKYYSHLPSIILREQRRILVIWIECIKCAFW